MKNILVVFLAGGVSKRLWPFGEKHFLNFFSKPLSFYSTLQLERFGFKNFLIVANKNNYSDFKKLKTNFSRLNIKIITQTDPRGMAGALISAEKEIKQKKILVVSPSDIYEDILVADFIKILKKKPQGVLSGSRFSGYFPGGYLKVKGKKVVDIVEKPSPKNLPSDIVTFVFDYFDNADFLLKHLHKVKSKKDDIFEKAIQSMIKDDYRFELLSYNGFWGYVKYPWHILNLSSYFLGKIRAKKQKNVKIAKSAVILGKVHIEDGVKILENVKIVGPSYIGANTIIGNNSVVRESLIGKNCVIGNSCEIVRSYVDDNCWFHTNYVGDSVVGSNCGMGSGAVLANFRLDEGSVKSKVGTETIDTGKIKLGAIIGDNVRIGVNSSIMPGIKIGNNSFVGSSVLLDKDLPSNKFCRMGRANYVIKDNKSKMSAKTRNDIRSKLKIH